MSVSREVFVVGAARTAIGTYGGTLKDIPLADLATLAVKTAIARSGAPADSIGHLAMGTVVVTEPRDAYLSRVAAVNAGIPKETPAFNVNRLCGSGLQAIISASQAILLGDCELAVGAGAEAMSRGGYLMPTQRWGSRMGDAQMLDLMTGALHDPFHKIHMGITAENVAKANGITREMQDALALASQQKASAAQEAGKFKDEIVSVSIPQRKGDPVVFNTDEFINKKTNADALAGLRPAFDKAGSVTAGNASGINDGAAAVMVMTAQKAAALGLTPLARIASFGTTGLDPAIMGMGPVSASQRALARAGWKASDVDLFELNEAFAAQACAVNKALDIDPAKVNVNGGAIAIGHPIGASGCRILVTLLHEMQRSNAKKGLAALCIGGGMGVALTLER